MYSWTWTNVPMCLKLRTIRMTMMMICRTITSQISNSSNSGSRWKPSKYNFQNDEHIIVQFQLYTFSYRKDLTSPQKLPKIAESFYINLMSLSANFMSIWCQKAFMNLQLFSTLVLPRPTNFFTATLIVSFVLWHGLSRYFLFLDGISNKKKCIVQLQSHQQK